jgi:hypothetical protein
MKLFGMLLLLLFAVGTVSAMTVYITPQGEKIDMSKLSYIKSVGTVPPKAGACIVKQNSYPNGTVFHTAYGIIGTRSDGSKICYVRQRSGPRNQTTTVNS